MEGFFMESRFPFALEKKQFMAEIIITPKPGKRVSKRSLRIDLTPMVDLGFLLITFFVFTSSMSQTTAMKVVMPDDHDSTKNDAVCESCALTLLPGKNNTLYYYEGMQANASYQSTTYDADGLRALIVRKKNQVKQVMHKDALVLIIRPVIGANFKNLVDIMDEATICKVARYYIAEPDEHDLAQQR